MVFFAIVAIVLLAEPEPTYAFRKTISLLGVKLPAKWSPGTTYICLRNERKTYVTKTVRDDNGQLIKRPTLEDIRPIHRLVSQEVYEKMRKNGGFKDHKDLKKRPVPYPVNWEECRSVKPGGKGWLKIGDMSSAKNLDWSPESTSWATYSCFTKGPKFKFEGEKVDHRHQGVRVSTIVAAVSQDELKANTQRSIKGKKPELAKGYSRAARRDME